MGRPRLGWLLVAVLVLCVAAPAETQEPALREVLLLGARNARKAGEIETAIARYRQLITLEPTMWEARAELGWLFLEGGRPREALAEFEVVARVNPDDAAAAAESVKGLLALRQLRRVEQELGVLLTRWPADRPLRLALAELRLLEMRYAEAEAIYAGLAREEPGRGARLGLADVAAALGDHQRAADVLEGLRRDFPEDPELARRQILNLASRQRLVEAYRELGRIQDRDLRARIQAELRNVYGEYSLAERELAELQGRHPADYGLLVGVAEALLGQEDDRGARTVYEALLGDYAEDVRARLALAEVLIGQRSYRDAEASLNRLPEASAYARYGRTKLERARGRDREATEELGRLVASVSGADARALQRRMLRDGEVASAVALSEAVLARGELDEALVRGYLEALLRKGAIARGKDVAARFEREAQDRSALRLLAARFHLVAGERAPASQLAAETEASVEKGNLYYELKNYAASRRAFEAVLQRDPWNVGATLGLARTLAAAGEPEAARQALERLLEAVPPPARTAVGALLGGVGGGTPEFYRVADLVLEGLAAAHPDNLDLQLARAQVAGQGRQNREMIARLTRLKAARPDSSLIRLRLARGLSWERAPEASAAYDDYLEQKPYDVHAWREKARAYGWMFEYEKAIAEWERIRDRYPEDEGTGLEREGKEALWRGRLRLARRAFEELVDREPENSEALFDLGQIASLGMRPSDAQDWYRHLLAVTPGHRQAAVALELSELYTRPRLDLGYAYLDQEGFEGKRLIRYGVATAEGRARLTDDVWARAGYQNVRFDFPRDSLSADIGTLGFAYTPSGQLHAEGFVSLLRYGDIGRETVNFGVGVSYETLPGIRLGADVLRRDLWENETTVRQGIHFDRLSASVRGDLGRYVDWAASGDVSRYSDDNTRAGGELTASYRLLWFPRTLRVIYRLTGFGFAEERAYFSPDFYATNTLALELRHLLGYPTREDYLAEAPRNAYSLYYGVSVDSNGRIFHEGIGRLTYGLTPRLGLGLSLGVIRSSVFKELNARIVIEYTF